MANYEIIAKTPIHIGSGEIWNSLYDFVCVKNQLYILNSEEIFRYLSDYKVKTNKKITSFEDIPMPLEEYLDVIKNNGNEKSNIKSILKDYFGEKDINNKLSIDFIKNYTKSTYYINRKNNNVDIEKFIRSANRLYIPGSSIKGALRTAYIHKFNEKNKGKNSFEFNQNPFGKFAEDEFKYLQVGDSKFISEENISIESISLDYIYDGGNAGVIVTECFSNGSTEFKLKTKGRHTNYDFLKEGNEDKFLKIVDEFYKFRLEEEIKVLEKLKKEADFKYDIILNKHREIKNNLKEGEYLIRLGKHKVNYDQSLLDLIDENEALKEVNKHREKKLISMEKFPISRKIIVNKNEEPVNICGWAVIRKVDE